MDTRPDHKHISEKWQKINEKSYKSTQNDKTPFTILMPPPNVTAQLHCGHALNNIFQDILARYKRIKGFNVCYVPGTDHAGIATQTKVEQMLKEKNITKESLGKEKFLEEVWAWKKHYGNTIINQLKKLGCSCDWSREKFTLDPDFCEHVTNTFIKMYNDNIIYQSEYIVNWSPVLKTAISDEEVFMKEEKVGFFTIKYNFIDSTDHVTISTTRPETIYGDVALAINPSDIKNNIHIGKHVLIPIVNRVIPIIGDHRVIIDFGTGIVKITPFNDKLDFLIGRTHGLKGIRILDESACMVNTNDDYNGLSVLAARKKIITELSQKGFLIGSVKKDSMIPHCYRTDAIVEPIVTKQFFVKMDSLIKLAKAMIDEHKIEIIPEKSLSTFNYWVDNIHDWCISRQLWWGHRIPIYYCKNQHLTCSKSLPDKCSICGDNNLTQDNDVLDTWFSSMLWPFGVFPESEVDYYFPTDTLITGSDIFFFWVIKMMFASGYIKNNIPFKRVYLHGLVRDEFHRKMSKSLGNGIDPLDIINQVGLDPVRFTFAYSTPKEGDIAISLKTFDVGKTFCTKYWNICRLCKSWSIMDLEHNTDINKQNLDDNDKIILDNLNKVIMLADEYFDQLEFRKASHVIYEFVWDTFANDYLEYCKKDIQYIDGNITNNIPPNRKNILRHILITITTLLHPIIPHITEEIRSMFKNVDFYPNVFSNFVF